MLTGAQHMSGNISGDIKVGENRLILFIELCNEIVVMTSALTSP